MLSNRDFIKFENLNEFSKNTNFLLKMRQVSDPIINDSDNDSIFTSIIDIRRLRKFHLDFFNRIFENIKDSIYELLYNEEHDIKYQTLILIKELFSQENQYYDDIGDWVIDILPILLEINVCNDEFFEISKQALLNISENMLISETIETFLEEIIESHDFEVKKLAYFYLMQNLDNFIVYNLENCVYWDCCLMILGGMYNLQGEIGKFAKNIIMFVREKIGLKEFNNIVDKDLDPSVKDLVICIINEISDKNEKKNFRNI